MARSSEKPAEGPSFNVLLIMATSGRVRAMSSRASFEVNPRGTNTLNRGLRLRLNASEMSWQLILDDSPTNTVIPCGNSIDPNYTP